MQLDLFEHSRQVMLRNAVIDALKRRDPDAGEKAVAALAAEYGADPLLADMEELCRRLRDSPLPDGFTLAATATLLRETEERCVPAAARVLGAAADAWLAPLWRALARVAADFPFDPQAETVHAAPLLMRAGDWQAAVASVEAIPSWRRRPAPLGWMIEARFRVDGLDAVWPMIAELAWMAPQRARLLLPQLSDSLLARQTRRFENEFDGSDAQDAYAWFPAWLLIEDGRLAVKLRPAEAGSATPPERCARLVMTLLALEREGRHAELVENRLRLRDINGALFAMYMQNR